MNAERLFTLCVFGSEFCWRYTPLVLALLSCQVFFPVIQFVVVYLVAVL